MSLKVMKMPRGGMNSREAKEGKGGGGVSN